MEEMAVMGRAAHFRTTYGCMKGFSRQLAFCESTISAVVEAPSICDEIKIFMSIY
jgi:hypothetical protein